MEFNQHLDGNVSVSQPQIESLYDILPELRDIPNVTAIFPECAGYVVYLKCQTPSNLLPQTINNYPVRYLVAGEINVSNDRSL